MNPNDSTQDKQIPVVTPPQQTSDNPDDYFSHHKHQDSAYKRLSHKLIPPLQAGISLLYASIASPNDPKVEDPIHDDQQTDLTSQRNSHDDRRGSDEEEDVAAAAGTGTARPHSNSHGFNFLSSGRLYSDVIKFVHNGRGSNRGEHSIPTLTYGTYSSGSEDDDDDEEEDEVEDDGYEDEDGSFDEGSGFEDAVEHSESEEDTVRYSASLMRESRSSDSKNSNISSLLTSLSHLNNEPDMGKITPFQKSMVENFSVEIEDGVLIRYREETGDKIEDLGLNIKLSIADRLQKVFELDDEDCFLETFNGWLVTDVFLQGHYYVTRNCLLFFAFLPDKFASKSADHSDGDFRKQDNSNIYIQTGALAMKTKKYGQVLGTVLTNRHWAILRPENLSIYSSPTDLYFPSLVIDLRNCIKAEIMEKYQPHTENVRNRAMSSPTEMSSTSVPSSNLHSGTVTPSRDSDDLMNDDEELNRMIALEAEENKDVNTGGVWFKITTTRKSYKFQTDNMYSARQWVSNISKIIFQLRNSNPKNEVLVKIPFSSMSTFHRKSLFNPDEEHTDPATENMLPTAFMLSYSNGEADVDEAETSAKKKQKKFQNKAKQRLNLSNDIEFLHFVFFSKGTEFYELVTQLMSEANKPRRASTESGNLMAKLMKKSSDTDTVPAGNMKPMSTLLPQVYPSSILERLINVNKEDFLKDPQAAELVGNKSGSKLKKIGKHLSNKVLFSSRSKSDLDSADVSRSTSNIVSPVESRVSPSQSTLIAGDGISRTDSGSPTNLNLPRRLSLTGLKNLNMFFDASKRNIEVAADRYGYNIKSDGGNKALGTPLAMQPPAMQPMLPALNLTDPSEYATDGDANKKKLTALGKSVKAINNVSTMWNANPYHYMKIGEGDDPYYVQDEAARDLGSKRLRSHFSLSSSSVLAASYFCHVQRALPVYGKLYVANENICFRSLLPGVSTKMILPLRDVENCYEERGSKITYYGLVLLIKGHDKLFMEFSSQKARTDCYDVILEMLHQFHDSETWEPMAHQWGKNYDSELGRRRVGPTADLSSTLTPSEETVKQASIRIESARIKLFEDRLSVAAGLQVPIVLEDSPFVKTEIRPNTSYHFVLLTIGSRGDVQPYIALGKGLIEEGHKVIIATHAEFEPWITKHGIGFKEIAGDPTELMSLMVTHGSMSLAFIKEASLKFKGWINELLQTAWFACQGADILIESPSSMAGIHIAEALGIPYMRAFTMPWTRTRAYSHAFIQPDQKKGGSYNYLTHVMFETIFWKGISSQVNKWRVEMLNIPKTNLYKLQQFKVPFLYNVSQEVLPPAVDFPDWVKVTGYWFLDEGAAKNYEPPTELIKFIERANEDGKKIVYIGFGSIVVDDAKSLTKAVIESVLEADVRCILNKGWSDRLSEKHNQKNVEVELPPEIYNSGAIPHDWLFPRIDAAVHHGGSGTTGATLRSGLPTIIKPFFGDQFFYSTRIEEIGAGIALRKLNAKSLTKALKTATSDMKMIEKAKQISEQIRNEQGVLSAIESIYSELEYARSLIVSKQLSNEQLGLPGLRSGNFTVNNSDDLDSELSD